MGNFQNSLILVEQHICMLKIAVGHLITLQARLVNDVALQLQLYAAAIICASLPDLSVITAAAKLYAFVALRQTYSCSVKK